MPWKVAAPLKCTRPWRRASWNRLTGVLRMICAGIDSGETVNRFAPGSYEICPQAVVKTVTESRSPVPYRSRRASGGRLADQVSTALVELVLRRLVLNVMVVRLT